MKILGLNAWGSAQARGFYRLSVLVRRGDEAVNETPLTDDAKSAIRKYMISLLALPGLLVSLLFFVLGFGVRDWAAKGGEVEAFQLAQSQLTQFVDKVTEDETKQLREEAELVKKDLDLQKAAANSENIRRDVAAELRADNSFVDALRTVTFTREYSWEQSQPPTDLGVREREGLCFLTRVIGKFDGSGEEVAIRSIDGRLRLTGKSQQHSVGASARCITMQTVE
jgi:hypothetical protein